jgi:hypothetical protein
MNDVLDAIEQQLVQAAAAAPDRIRRRRLATIFGGGLAVLLTGAATAATLSGPAAIHRIISDDPLDVGRAASRMDVQSTDSRGRTWHATAYSTEQGNLCLTAALERTVRVLPEGGIGCGSTVDLQERWRVEPLSIQFSSDAIPNRSPGAAFLISGLIPGDATVRIVSDDGSDPPEVVVGPARELSSVPVPVRLFALAVADRQQWPAELEVRRPGRQAFRLDLRRNRPAP